MSSIKKDKVMYDIWYTNLSRLRYLTGRLMPSKLHLYMSSLKDSELSDVAIILT